MNEDTFRLHHRRGEDTPLLQSLQQRQDHLLRLAAHRQLGNELRQRGFQPTEIPTVVRDMMVQAMQVDGMPAALEVLRRAATAGESSPATQEAAGFALSLANRPTEAAYLGFTGQVAAAERGILQRERQERGAWQHTWGSWGILASDAADGADGGSRSVLSIGAANPSLSAAALGAAAMPFSPLLGQAAANMRRYMFDTAEDPVVPVPPEAVDLTQDARASLRTQHERYGAAVRFDSPHTRNVFTDADKLIEIYQESERKCVTWLDLEVRRDLPLVVVTVMRMRRVSADELTGGHIVREKLAFGHFPPQVVAELIAQATNTGRNDNVSGGRRSIELDEPGDA